MSWALTADLASPAASHCAAVCAGEAGSYISGTALVVDGANYLYKKPDVPVDVVLKASRGELSDSILITDRSLSGCIRKE